VLDGVLLASISEGMDPEEEWRDGFALFFGQNRFRHVVDEMVPLSVSTVWMV
jgi:hypothetical protein